MATRTDADVYIDALRSCATRLRGLVTPMSEADLTRSAYPAEGSIAHVLSHLGSGAVIMQRRLDDTLALQATSDDASPGRRAVPRETEGARRGAKWGAIIGRRQATKTLHERSIYTI